MRVFKPFLIITIMLIPGALCAQEADTLDINDAIRLGIENNFSIQIARNNQTITSNNNTLGNAGFLPSVTADASLTNRIQDNRTVFAAGTIPDRDDRGAETTVINYGIDANWTIFDGLSMFAVADRLEIESERSELETQLQIEAVLSDIISGYFQIVGQQQAYNVLENTLEISRERIRIAETKLDLGSGSKYDLLQAQADFNADQAALIRTGTGLKQAKVIVNQILAIPVDQKFNVQSFIQLGEPLDLDQVLSLANEQNLQLNAARLSEQVAASEIREITGEWFPQITLGGGYRFNRVEASQGFSELNESSGFSYGITARVNLFDGLNKSRRRQNASVELKNEQIRNEEQHFEINARIVQTFEAYDDALALIQLEEENLNINQESLDIALERYRLGTINSVELREAQLSLLNAENRLISAKIEAKLAETELLRLSGVLVNRLD